MTELQALRGQGSDLGPEVTCVLDPEAKAMYCDESAVKCLPEADRESWSESGSADRDDGDSTDADNEERGVWASKAEFLLAIVGYTVGIGSVWRFPIICARNGGGAFLIPFFFFLITSGGPLYYLEVCLGQFTGKSAGLAFEYCPLFKGLGLLQVCLSLTVLWYAVAILSWVFYFLFYSFFPVLPWTTCGNWWNTPSCTVLEADAPDNTDASSVVSYGLAVDNTTTQSLLAASTNVTITRTSAALEFWQHNVIRKSDGLENMGGVQLHLVICLFLAWVFVVLAVIKGVKTLGKVVYVTATMPYIFLTVMLVRGLTLEGAVDGVVIYLKPDFTKLASIQVWLEAAIQVFYSLGPSWGGVITMASYNKFHQKSFRATAICVASSGFTSFYNGLVVFSIIGFMARESGMTVNEVASASGPGLAFVAFPTALSRMPLAQLWSLLFFLTLVTVVFDSLFGMLETVTSGIIDYFPKQLTSRRVLVNILTGLAFFLTGLPLTMNGGVYLFQLSDWYFSQFALLVGSGLEAVTICWIYGTDRFSRDVAAMTGRDVSVLLRIFWAFIIPVFVLITFLVMLSRYSRPDYGDGYEYQDYAVAMGIGVGMLPIAAMLAQGVWMFGKTHGSIGMRLASLLRPSRDWYPNDHKMRDTYDVQPYRYEGTLRERIIMNIRGPKDTPYF